MYIVLLIIHSLLRWLVLLTLVLAIFRAWRGLSKEAGFTRLDNRIRHWTATTAHLQLMVGILLYIKSPVAQYAWRGESGANGNQEIIFFAVIHALLMLAAVIVLTIGSALAKRRATDRHKFATILLWFSAAFLLIMIAIPWPFSPLASRPYLRY